MVRPLAIAMLLAGCADVCPPPEAHGGTDAEEAAAEAEAEAFLGLMREEICVPRMKLGELRGTSIGKYTPTTRHIKIEEERPLDEIRTTVRHELCHALQYQAGLDLSGPEFSLALPLEIPDRERPGEAWAYTCQYGPEPAWLMGDTCDDDPFGTVIFERVREQFLPSGASLERPVRFDEVGRLAVGAGSVWFAPLQGGGLSVEHADGASEVVDLRTGMPAPPAPPLAEGPADAGDKRLLYYTAFAANGANALRLVYEDAEGLSRAGCVRTEETPFAVDGELWSVYRDREELVWGLWSVE